MEMKQSWQQVYQMAPRNPTPPPPIPPPYHPKTPRTPSNHTTNLKPTLTTPQIPTPPPFKPLIPTMPCTSGRSRIFTGGGTNPHGGAPGYIFFIKLSPKLHEIENNLVTKGGCALWVPPLGSTTDCTLPPTHTRAAPRHHTPPHHLLDHPCHPLLPYHPWQSFVYNLVSNPQVYQIRIMKTSDPRWGRASTPHPPPPIFAINLDQVL